MPNPDENSASRVTSPESGGQSGGLSGRLGPGTPSFLAAALFWLLAVMEWLTGGSLWVGVTHAAVGAMLSARGAEKRFFKEITPIFGWKSAGTAPCKEGSSGGEDIKDRTSGRHAPGRQEAHARTGRLTFQKALWWVRLASLAIVLGLFVAYGVPSLAETVAGTLGVLLFPAF